ncbi:ARM repeat-containing protein [Cystobasidium minutum MCA 4210]|uniref:ARM repeat-containing protein n=1 Tax=Cystobasidium minutum MCA 4210 TaxID=1397322 RepID=UPI0034CEDFB5|eukprot:jgi/Rhomi1/158209/estExt_Genewise1Plus.C_2_t20399
MAEETTTAARQSRRTELRAANLAAWQDGGPDSDDFGSLDSSLKRNTAFIKRLRTSLQASDSVAALLNEVKSLSLERYVSELVPAAIEGISRCKTGIEIYGAVEVISALHQRFPELFTVPFIASLQASLQPPNKATLATLPQDQREKEENARVLRQRSLLRIYAELELAGIIAPAGKALGESTFTVFRDLLTADKELLAISIPLAVAFTKHLGQAFLPPPSAAPDAAGPTPAESSDDVNTTAASVPIAEKDKFRKLLMAYYDALSRRAVKDHTHLLETDRRNHDAYIRSGEIFEDRAQNYEKLVRGWEKLWSGVQSIAESLGVPLPTLPPLASTSVITGTGTSTLSNGQSEDTTIGGPGSPWNDEEEKRFYTDLPDLRGEVPGSLLRQMDDTAAESGGNEMEEEAPPTDKPTTSERPGTADEAKEQDDGMAPAPAAQLAALLSRLPDLSNRDAIDKVAVEFTFLNSKAARRRLVKVVTGVPRTRQDLIPYYARLVATLNRYMPDVGAITVATLEDEFRYFQRKKGQDLAESRAKNIRFMSELTKFGVTPSHSILHIMKVCLDDFTGSNIDNLCTLLETCGRFLLKSEATREKMAAMLETVKRKKNVQNLDQRQSTMLDNAYYQCDPPDRPIVVPKERSPMVLYIRHLLYGISNKLRVDHVIQQIRKLHWEDPTIVRKLYNAFTKVWKIKFSNIYLFAILVHDLTRFHPEFCISVVDGVLENIVVEMEHNNFKQNQQRVATVKYLGELYTYRVIEARVVLDTLWTLVTFGHPDGRPQPGEVPGSMDTQDDYFRIRLVCTLLDACGQYFDRGQLRKRMDSFLTFFQMYVRTKRQPLPMDVDFMLTDTLETIRPKTAIITDYEATAKAVDDMFAAATKQGAMADSTAPDELDASDGEDDSRSRPESQSRLSGDDLITAETNGGDSSELSTSETSDDETSSSAESSDDDEDEEDEAIDDVANEEQDEFDRELARMMAESGREARQPATMRRNVLNERSLPVLKRQPAPLSKEDEDSQHMRFTLLMKKGTKQQTKSMEVPRESALAMHTLTKQQQDKEEQQQLKQLVLKYERQEEAENRKAWVDEAGKKGYRIKFGQ